MNRINRISGLSGLAAIAAFAAWAAVAQDEEQAAEIKPRPAEIMPLAPESLLLDVTHTGERFVAVGDRGHILLSQDATTWEQVNVPVRAPLTAVHFPDPGNGWAVGHDATILRTSDGGKTWSLQNFEPELEMPFLDVLFLDSNRGFAAGAYGLFYQTSDGGQTWAEVDAPEVREEEVHLNGLIRLDNGDLLIVGEMSMLAMSTDQGETWIRLESPYESSLFGAVALGEKGALVFGLRGNAYMTQNVRSNQWTELDTGSVASMFGGTRLPNGDVAMVGLNGIILVADEAGNVRSMQAPAGKSLSSAIPLDGSLLAVGQSGVQNVAVR